MAANEKLEFHKKFLKWYREVSIDDNRERLTKRHQGLLNLVSKLTSPDIDLLLSRLLGKGVDSELDRLCKPFIEADDLFDTEENDREIDVLFASALAILIESNSHVAARAALSIKTALLYDARSFNELPMNLGALSEEAIQRIAEENRERPDLSLKISTNKVSFNSAKQKITQQPDVPMVANSLDLMAESVNSSLAELIHRINSFSEDVNAFLRIQDEELEILWWALGERSKDLDQPFSKLPHESKPLILAKELADATHLLPGPVSTRSILARTGLGQKSITIPAAVNSCDEAWLNSLEVSHNVSLVSKPVHSAIFRKLETGDSDSWIAGWSSGSGIQKSHKTSPILLATQFYYERLLSVFEE